MDCIYKVFHSTTSTQSASQYSHSPIHTMTAEAAIQGANLLIVSNLGFSILLKVGAQICNLLVAKQHLYHLHLHCLDQTPNIPRLLLYVL